MTSTVTGPAEIPEFGVARSAGCPFDPAPAMRARRDEGSVVRVRLWDGSTPWLVTGYAEHRALLADSRVSADHSRPGMPRLSAVEADSERSASSLSFIMMDDPEHARLRRMASGAFSVKRVNAMRPATQRIVDAQIDALLAGPRPVDLVEAFALPVPSLVISDLLGVPYENHDFFQRNSRIIINRDSTDEQRGGAVFQLAGYLDELMGAKLASPTRWPCWNTPTSWLVCATPATRRWWLRRWTSCCAT